eukprot:scaffold647860_cov46-Prasinocladus_malaysianus.AAC.1
MQEIIQNEKKYPRPAYTFQPDAAKFSRVEAAIQHYAARFPAILRKLSLGPNANLRILIQHYSQSVWALLKIKSSV